MPLKRHTGPYIPRADGELREWLHNFATVVQRNPFALFLTPEDVLRLSDLAHQYEMAYERANAPGTRTRVAVADKNTVRKEVWRTVRPICMRIKVSRGISNQLKIKLGVKPPITKQLRIGKPRSAPKLSVLKIKPGVHRLECRDTDHPERFAKPPGAIRLDLLIRINDKPARTPRGPGRLHTATRHVFNVSFKPDELGKIATYFGRWSTRRGLAGPWSQPLAMRIV